jgi:transglutaminase-like putative cysteine protease
MEPVMSRLHLVPAIAVVAAAWGCAAGGESSPSREDAAQSTAAPAQPSARSRAFELHYEATVKSAPEGSHDVDLWLPVAQESAFQKVRLANVAAPAGHEITVEPALGNKIFHVRVPASSLPLVVRLDYDVTRAERKTDLAAAKTGATLAASDRSKFLDGTALVPVGEKVTAMTGFHASGDDKLAVARQSYEHVLGKMKYGKPEGKAWGNGSTEYACKEGVGNCTDFHAYFMSLTRTNGIPARFLMGMSLPTDKHEGEIPGYHCWAEFFDEGRGWVPVDISEADKVADTKPDMVEFYFGGLTVDRVEFTTGRDVALVPPQKGAPLNYFINPYCEIDGKAAPKDAVVRKVTFKDAAGS